jgi:23S rRNA (uracil1939-C5)-methyltransferase
MGLNAGEEVELVVDKPAAGGRMIGRHEGQVVFVQGAIPGERVRARVQRAEKRLAFAAVTTVLEPSPDRRPFPSDPACGGCLYAHIAYPRQLAMKAAIVSDAFARIGKVPIETGPDVVASPERAYRMRARLHVRGRTVGFYREGTHELCDAAATWQLREDAVRAAAAAAEALAAAGCAAHSLEISETIAADECVVHVDPAAGSAVTEAAVDAAMAAGGLTGCTARDSNGVVRTAGVPVVRDPLTVLTSGRAGHGSLQRHAESFFQANRYLLPAIVTAVLDAVPAEGNVLDLYAGVGLFAVSLGAAGRERITAVEGDRSSGGDLTRNAAQCGSAIRVYVESVEDFVARSQVPAQTVIVDPPRTGISAEAIAGIVKRGARRIVYVSCDPPTMARDARLLVDGGYGLSSLQAYDLFPNTPHVETLGVFDRS